MIAQSKELVEAQYCVAKGYEHDAKVRYIIVHASRVFNTLEYA